MVDADNDDMDQILVRDLGVQSIQDGNQLSRQESQHSENEKISSASIPSDFVSVDTPSLDLSRALSENERMNKVDVERSFDGLPGTRQFYYEYTDLDMNISTSCSHSKVTEESQTSSSSNGNKEYHLNSKESLETNYRGLEVSNDDSQGTSTAYSRVSRNLFALEEEEDHS